MQTNKNSSNKWIWILFLSILTTLITLVLLYFYIKDKPSVIYDFKQDDKPIVQIEDFRISLKKLGILIKENKDSSFAIFINNINDLATMGGKLPIRIDTSIKSAIISISSPKILLKGIFDIKKLPLYPNNIYIINGGITEFNSKKELIYIKLNLNPLDARTGNYIKGINVEVSMSFYETKSGNKGFSIKSQSYNISGNTLKNYDKYSIITILSRLATIELIGRLRNYPYWNCIEDSKVNFELLNKKVDLELSQLNQEKISIPK